jgi:hypothetical protein
MTLHINSAYQRDADEAFDELVESGQILAVLSSVPGLEKVDLVDFYANSPRVAVVTNVTAKALTIAGMSSHMRSVRCRDELTCIHL